MIRLQICLKPILTKSHMSSLYRINLNQTSKSSRSGHSNTMLRCATIRWFTTSDKWMGSKMSTKFPRPHLLWWFETNQTWQTIQVQLQTSLVSRFQRLTLGKITSIHRRLHSSDLCLMRSRQLLIPNSSIEQMRCKRLKWCSSIWPKNFTSQCCPNICLHGNMAVIMRLLRALLPIGNRYQWSG